MVIESDKEIKEIFEYSKVIVVAGMSGQFGKPAHNAPNYLKEQGYKIIPVNPNANEILGERAYDKIEEITENADVVDIF